MRTLGPWQLIRRLGAGGSAEVFLARGPGPRGEREVALKVLLPHLAEDPAHASLLQREARAVGGLCHPNIAELYEVGEVEGRVFLAMEYVRGAPLSALLKAMRVKGEQVPLGIAAYLVREAALGLHHAHQAQLIHRDVSPHNLMVSFAGEVKVVDFGMARDTQEGATATGGLKGKLRYMPPEQLRSQELDLRVDVFALGALLWDLALGQPLYPGPAEADMFQQALFLPQPHPDEVKLGLPRAFVQVLQPAVARERERRTPTALALSEALLPLVEQDAAAALGALLARVLGEGPGALPKAAPGPAAPPSPHGPGGARVAPALAPVPKVTARSSRIRIGAQAEELQGTVAGASRAARRGAPSFPIEAKPKPRPTRVFPEEEPEPSITAADREQPRRRRSKAPVAALLAVVALAAVGAAAVVAVNPWRKEPQATLPPHLELALPEPSSALPAKTPPRTSAPPTAAAPRRPQGLGMLAVESVPNAVVRTGGKELGLTPVTVELPAGRHSLQLRSVDGKQGATVEVEVPRGGRVERRVLLEPL